MKPFIFIGLVIVVAWTYFVFGPLPDTTKGWRE